MQLMLDFTWHQANGQVMEAKSLMFLKTKPWASQILEEEGALTRSGSNEFNDLTDEAGSWCSPLQEETIAMKRVHTCDVNVGMTRIIKYLLGALQKKKILESLKSQARLNSLVDNVGGGLAFS